MPPHTPTDELTQMLAAAKMAAAALPAPTLAVPAP
jgi:hypothetical protein